MYHTLINILNRCIIHSLIGGRWWSRSWLPAPTVPRVYHNSDMHQNIDHAQDYDHDQYDDEN